MLASVKAFLLDVYEGEDEQEDEGEDEQEDERDDEGGPADKHKPEMKTKFLRDLLVLG